MTIFEFKQMLLSYLGNKPFFLEFNLTNDSKLEDLINATQNHMETAYVEGKTVIQVFMNLEKFDLKLNERNREVGVQIVKGLKMSDSVEVLSDKLRAEAIKENQNYEHGDLYIIFENGFEMNALNIKEKKLSEIGITRFSRLNFCFKMIEMVFRVLDDTSTHYIGLQGAERVNKKDFIKLVKDKYTELPQFFSIIKDGEQVLEGHMIENTEMLVLEDLRCTGQVNIQCYLDYNKTMRVSKNPTIKESIEINPDTEVSDFLG